MATNLVAKWGKITYPPAFIALSIQNGMGYRYHNGHVNSTNDASTPCLKKNDNDVAHYNFNAH